jgi:beta-glucosidase
MTDSIRFPANFTWGVATSAFQIEGAFDADGKGPSIWDTFSHDAGQYHRPQQRRRRLRPLPPLPRGRGADGVAGRGRLPLLDGLVARAAGGKGAWNEKGFDFYKRLLDALDEKGMAGHLTLYHWDLPQGLQDDGGWMSRDTAHRFADYAAEVARRFGDRLATIATHNEPWCTANLGYGNGQFAPGVADKKQAIQVSHHLLLSHGLAMQAMRARIRRPNWASC